jgi:serine/threonine-protein kinase RsbW
VDKSEFVLPSKLESIDEAVVAVVKFATNVGFTEDAIFGIDMAVREAVANAVKHGNRFDETKFVEITLSNTQEVFEVLIRDFGDGFEVEEVPDPTNPENLLKANGRGILFMNNFMDEVEWFNHPKGGTIVKMIKNHN